MKRLIKWLSITVVILVVSMSALIYLLPIPPLLTGISYSRAVYDEHHHLLRLTLSQDQQYRLLTPLANISSELTSATLLQEDQYFQWHIGINPISLLRAWWETYVVKSRRMGASTITMQVARMRYGINSKTFSGKFWQMTRALQLEAHYSKEQILEAYLNLAPYGNNIQGVGAASLVYFGKSANTLSLPEALTLAVIPQNPLKRLPDRPRLQAARSKLYQRWLLKHPEDISMKSLIDLPLQLRSVHDTPFLAPHFVNEILTRNSTDSQLSSTLDLKLQNMIERITQQYIARKSVLGINNAAVMLVDTRTLKIKALLGSASFANTAIEGQIDGTKTKRSPGSALKPFIYALAIDQGLIHPNTVLKDVPHSFGNYNPENFDNDFVGPIKAKDALILSRNIPAIYLADQLNHPTFYEFLQQAEITNLQSASFYGLSLVLGGAELSMQELVSLYAALANAGKWRPLIFTNHQRSLPWKQILSPEASFLVLDMLKDAQRPHGTLASARDQDKMIAWKTGTSSGYRDAWTIGIVGPYVLAVWIGNFNNQGNPAFIGKEVAAPLFFEITTALNAELGALPAAAINPGYLHLTKVAVCKSSGMLPNHYCPDTEQAWFIPGKSPIKIDNIHREVAIDAHTGLRACKFDQDTRFEVFEFWSSDLLQVYQRAGLQHRMPPAYDPQCTLNSKVGEGFAPQIISPQTQTNYIARVSAATTTIIPFTAVVDADVKQVYWFLNENYLGKSARDKTFLWNAKPGRFVIRVVDDYGRSDARDISIQAEK
jgi:penicillin-binding protein 1C